MNTDMNKLQTVLGKKRHTLEIISEFSRSLNSAKSLKNMSDVIMLTCMGHKGIEVTGLLSEKQGMPDTFSVRFVKGAGAKTGERQIRFSPILLRKLAEEPYVLIKGDFPWESPRTMQTLKALDCRMLMPLFYQERLTGMLSCAPKVSGQAYSDDDIEFLQLITSHAGIAIHNILMLDRMEKNNMKLEKKIFELQVVDKINRALTGSLEMEKICHILIMTVARYLTAGSACFFVRVHQNVSRPDQFRRVASIGSNPSDTFQTIQASPELMSQIDDQEMIQKSPDLPKPFSRLFQDLKAEICFPVRDTTDNVLGLSFFGSNLSKQPYNAQELKLATLLVRQAYPPIRNSQFYSQTCEYSHGLEQRVKERARELAEANNELRETRENLRTTQAQLIESEKMAALGHLIANIVHEIHTPLSAIRAAADNISDALNVSIRQLPILFQQLSPELHKDFHALLKRSFQSKRDLVSKKQDKSKRELLIAGLEARGIDDADATADILSDMGIYEDVDPFARLLGQENNAFILHTAYNLSAQQHDSETILTAAARASKIVSALKSYVHFDDPGPTLANIPEEIDIVLGLYHHRLNQSIEVIRKYEDVPDIRCHPGELNQVWTHLIHNAIQSMENGGILKIAVSPQDQQIIVQITDSGSGIPDEIRDRIFDPFFTTKPPEEGNGLGLDTVRKIVGRHQGTIEVESQPGRTTFSVLLPISL